ncbi:MAG: 4Fe-4S binding protein, partial [Myxococcales bacterium]|nr:4Fe-4S binding protein [Myxococcales bacterium]
MTHGRLPQIFRRGCQVGVILFLVYAALGGPWRNYKVAHNLPRIVTMLEGPVWGTLYGWNDAALARFGDPYGASLGVLGMPWASRVFGVDTADPLLVASHVLRNGAAPGALLAGLALPLGLALLLGKVFCSHLCPMRLVFEIGQGFRAGLVRLGVPLPELRHRARFGGWVLVGGLGAAAFASSALWLFVLPYASFSVSLFVLLTTGALSGLALVVALWLAVDVLIAPGYFCRNLCPTGFLLEQFARFSPFALRKDTATGPCPGTCRECEIACPYGLSPKQETHRPACDSCGRCVSACPSTKLRRSLRLPFGPARAALAALGALVLVAGPAEAHHNKGLPHYGYFENYPQVPTDEYVAIQGRWEIGATIFNFQGLDRRTADTPNDVKIYLYLYDLKDDHAYLGPVDFEIRRGGAAVARFTREHVDEEAVYSTRETLPRSGTYDIVARLLDAPGGTATLPFSVDLATDRINWALIGAIAAPVLGLFGLALSRRFGRRRRPPKRASHAVARAALVALATLAATATPIRTTHAETTVATVAPSPAAKKTKCPVCGMWGCKMNHLKTDDGGQVMVMSGIPRGLFVGGAATLIVLSFFVVEWIAPVARRGRRWNLAKNKRVYRLLRSRWFQAVPQLAMAAVFAFLIYAGLEGSRVANITPVAVWTLWWAGLIFMILLAGPLFCFACPWDALANLATRLRLAARVEPISLGFTVPAWLRNLFPALILFVILTWLELGYGVTTNPRATAYMGLAMAGAAVAMALAFDGKAFCRYACPVGRISGMYANFSPVEIRARNPRACQSCETEDCLNGNERGYACPTGISLTSMTTNTYCTVCTECIKSCDRHNVAINLRPFGADLLEPSPAGRSVGASAALSTPRWDEAWLALMLLALTLFHGLSMTPSWESFEPGRMSLLKWMGTTLGTPKTVNFTLAMAVVVAAPVGLYWVACRAAAAWTHHVVDTTRLFRHFAMSLLPVALFYHLAHNA